MNGVPLVNRDCGIRLENPKPKLITLGWTYIRAVLSPRSMLIGSKIIGKRPGSGSRDAGSDRGSCNQGNYRVINRGKFKYDLYGKSNLKSVRSGAYIKIACKNVITFAQHTLIPFFVWSPVPILFLLPLSSPPVKVLLL